MFFFETLHCLMQSFLKHGCLTLDKPTIYFRVQLFFFPDTSVEHSLASAGASVCAGFFSFHFSFMAQSNPCSS